MSGCCCSTATLAGLQALISGLAEEIEDLAFQQSIKITPLPLTELDVTTLTSSFSEALSDSNPKKYILIENKSDGDIYGSYEGLEDNFKISSGSSLRLDLAAMLGYWDEDIFLRQDTVSVPTFGTILITAFY